MATTFKLPKRITEGNNLWGEAELAIVERTGVYVTVWRADTPERVELIEEGGGAPDELDRIIKYARSNRRRYVEQRIADALEDDWFREELGLAPQST